jgi:hypothetical protein
LIWQHEEMHLGGILVGYLIAQRFSVDRPPIEAPLNKERSILQPEEVSIMPSPATQMKVTSALAPTGDVATAPPLEHKKIARLAYSYWGARGRPEGSPEEDWFRAEEELRRRKSAFEVGKERRRHSPRARISSRGRQSTG